MPNSRNPETVSRDAFLTALGESGLFSPDDLRDAAQVPMGDAADGPSLARALVRARKLTTFQAEAVLKRRFDDLRIGIYDVLSQLGKGGMGTVYRARHRRMKREVALKVLSHEVSSQGSFVQRFQREVEVVAQLQHPNVVMAFDAGEDQCGHYLVMEFVNGRDLASDVQQGGAMSVAEAVECVVQAARGLEYAHSRNLVHRDVKPANLLRDNSGVVKVADLGLARLSAAASDPSAASLTQAGGIVGTTDYMAPEQAVDSTTIDRRADVYSLGCTLYYLLTARPVYQANSLMGLLLKHREASIPHLRHERPDVPQGLDAIFSKAVAKRPEDRHQSMTELIEALESLRRATTLPTQRGAPAVPTMTAVSATDMTVAADTGPLGKLETATEMKPSSSMVDVLPTPSDAGRVAGLAVVLAETSRTQAGIVKKYLQQLNLGEVHVVGSVAQALQAAKATGAQVLLSAMHLSDGTGVQLAQRLRAEAGCAAVGFVLMTSEADGGEAAVVQALGNSVVLPKPFDLRRLARAMADATGRTADVTGA
jgi:serine/threonine protein kinase/CheY-like chemotaxis protein